MHSKAVVALISVHRDIALGGIFEWRTSSDVMGYLQGVQMKLMMWINNRNEHKH